MSFTSLTIIKKHLLNGALSPLQVENHEVTLNGTDAVELPHHSLVESSETVKWRHTLYPVAEDPLTLLNYDWQNLTFCFIVKDTVVVALDTMLSVVYLEEVDYKVDYSNGCIRRVPGSSIADAQPVRVYYDKYSRFERDTDYDVDYTQGKLLRTEGGGIPDGATVLIDYAVYAGTALDDLIALAISEADDIITRSLAPDFSSESSETGLQTGATELVLSIIARDMAGETLMLWRGTDSYQRAKEWRELSTVYEQRAYQTLAPYLLPNYMRSSQAISREG